MSRACFWVAAAFLLLPAIAHAQPEPTPAPEETPAPTPDPEPEPEPPAEEKKPGAFKLSGYMQSRFAATQGDASTFFIRRGRLKGKFATEHTQLQLQLEARPSGVTFFDGWVGFTEPWSGQKLGTLLIGQKNLPFGFEADHSSSKRWFLERSRIVRVLFPKERDHGAFLYGSWSVLRVNIAAVNGQGVESAFADNDPTTIKNVLGRVGVDLEWLRAGVSFYQGNRVFPDSSGGPGATVVGDMTRLGADFGVTAELIPSIGPSTVYLEFIQGTDISTDIRGGYFGAVQELAFGFTAGLRYSIFDPDVDTDEDGSTALDLVLAYDVNKHVRLRIEGNINLEEAEPAIDNNALVLGAQLKF